MLWKEEKKQELTNRKKEETMGKVFGYPEFDENGEQILTTYDNEYKDLFVDGYCMLWFAILSFPGRGLF